ncbi:hypothetical protein [uncultured Eubacterium sp.]|uniref:hypothetical protein n=1 Tax=Eubacterium sp. TaxID=142586 RepID=UPI003266D70A
MLSLNFYMKKIDGCDLGTLKIGGRAIVYMDGRRYLTSPITDYFVAGGIVRIHTANSVYSTKED